MMSLFPLRLLVGQLVSLEIELRLMRVVPRPTGVGANFHEGKIAVPRKLS